MDGPNAEAIKLGGEAKGRDEGRALIIGCISLSINNIQTGTITKAIVGEINIFTNKLEHILW